MIRPLAALLVLATLGAIGWHAYAMLPQGRLIPGFARFVLVFHGGVALAYLAALALLARRDGRDGLRLAAGAALVNGAWALPLGALLFVFAGFALGNREQLHEIFAVAAGALLQPALLALAGIGLWRARTPGVRASRAWTVALAVPIVASGASWIYFDWQAGVFRERSALAARNDRAAQETVQMLRACLAAFAERGYPAGLDACPDAAARLGAPSGYRFEYLPALAAPGEPRRAYLLCAQPIEFRATGYNTLVADGAGHYGAGVAERATPDEPPTCASVLPIERAILWCAYAYAASAPAAGYPARLADIAPCVAARRAPIEIGADRLKSERGEPYVYLAEPPGADGRIARFRVHRAGLPAGAARWIDSDLRESAARIESAGPIVAGLPDLAAPERFAPGCAEGRAADCFVAGLEWQRKARQSGGAAGPAGAPLRAAARDAFERGCALGDGRACSSLAGEASEASGAERDVRRIAALYEKACTLGDALGCREAAQMFESGRKARAPALQSAPPAAPVQPDLERDGARALALYGRACDLGEREACFIAARQWAAGESVAPDRARAFALFTRLCDDGWALACERAARLDAAKEKDYLRRACVLGEAGACEPAGR